MGRKSRAKVTQVETPVAQPARTVALPENVWAVCAALVVLIVIIYAQAGSHSFLNYDDNLYITNNPHVKAGLTAAALRWSLTALAPNWHPLTWWTYLIDITLFGVHAAPMLYANVLLHIASTLLLFFILRAATGMFWRSAAVAALFAVHPLRVESVAWVAERKDVLSGLFFFLTIWCYVRWTQSRSRAAYATALVMFILGLCAKQMLVTLPFLLIVIDYWPLKRFNLKEKIPFFVVLVPAIAAMFLTQQKIEAIATTELVSPAARLANAVLSYVAYLGKIFWPSHLAIPYPLRIVISPADVVFGIVILLAITAAAWAARKRHPYLLSGWLWYLGVLVPVIGIVQIGSQSMADRYTYLPSVGILFAVVWLAADLVKQRQPLMAITCLLVVVLTILSFVQTGYWKDSETLFRHSVAVTEKNRIAHTFLGLALLEKNQHEEAASEFRAALALNPNDELARNGLGTALAASGNTNASEEELRATIAGNPNGVDAYRQLGRILLSSGRREEAIPILQKAIDLKPDTATRAALASAKGNTDEAIALYREAVQANPAAPDAHNDLAAALARAGRDQEALAEYREALRLDPHQYDVLMNLGALLSRMNDNDGAAAQFHAAAKERPKSPEPHVYLALTYASANRIADAIGEVNAAIAINHDGATSALQSALRQNTTIDDFLAHLQSQRPPS
jgi:tetratricopeptide (TPR) repeat protein